MNAQFGVFRPSVVWCEGSGTGEDEMELPQPPSDFTGEIADLFSKIYGSKTSKLQNGYNPVIIGYDHNGAGALHRNIELLRANNGKAAIEVLPPAAFDWIRDFLKDEQEYKERGTIYGKKPDDSIVRQLKSYRSQLVQNHGQGLLLWMLENNFAAISLEHSRVMDWIQEDERNSRLATKSSSVGIPWHRLRPFYTAIRRDLHGLQVLVEEKPDVICTGAYHALKYDFLLGRSGEKSFYLLTERFVRQQMSWGLLVEMWRAAHNLYLQHPPLQEGLYVSPARNLVIPCGDFFFESRK